MEIVPEVTKGESNAELKLHNYEEYIFKSGYINYDKCCYHGGSYGFSEMTCKGEFMDS